MKVRQQIVNQFQRQRVNRDRTAGVTVAAKQILEAYFQHELNKEVEAEMNSTENGYGPQNAPPGTGG